MITSDMANGALNPPYSLDNSSLPLLTGSDHDVMSCFDWSEILKVGRGCPATLQGNVQVDALVATAMQVELHW